MNPATIVDDTVKDEFLRIQSSNFYQNYKFNINELTRIKVDISSIDLKSPNKDSAAKAVEFTKNSLILYPEVKPLVRFLKRLLQVTQLNNSFNGNY